MEVKLTAAQVAIMRQVQELAGKPWRVRDVSGTARLLEWKGLIAITEGEPGYLLLALTSAGEEALRRLLPPAK